MWLHRNNYYRNQHVMFERYIGTSLIAREKSSTTMHGKPFLCQLLSIQYLLGNLGEKSMVNRFCACNTVHVTHRMLPIADFTKYTIPTQINTQCSLVTTYQVLLTHKIVDKVRRCCDKLGLTTSHVKSDNCAGVTYQFKCACQACYREDILKVWAHLQYTFTFLCLYIQHTLYTRSAWFNWETILHLQLGPSGTTNYGYWLQTQVQEREFHTGPLL